MARKKSSFGKRVLSEKRGKIPFFLLVSLIFFAIIFLAYSRYMVKTELRVEILNQASSCYSGQDAGSGAKWSGGSIMMQTAFETPDPCYKADSIKAVQQGERIEVNIKTVSGGVCIQCFGFRKLEYEILSPKAYEAVDIYVGMDDATKHHVRLLLS
jgi:hypothetical protein